MALVVVGSTVLVEIVRRVVEELQRALSLQWLSDFFAVNSLRMKEDSSMGIGVWERRGGVCAVVEVVMVIMTSGGTPTGCARRLSTEEIIFVSRCSSTGIVQASPEELPLNVACHHCRE